MSNTVTLERNKSAQFYVLTLQCIFMVGGVFVFDSPPPYTHTPWNFSSLLFFLFLITVDDLLQQIEQTCFCPEQLLSTFLSMVAVFNLVIGFCSPV